MKKFLALSLLVGGLQVTAQARPGDDMNNGNTAEKKNECSVTKMTDGQIINGILLRGMVGDKLRALAASERAKGKDPKVFVIGRVGQDFSGVLTLKDQMNGRSMSVRDIMNDINPNFYTNENGSVDIARVQQAIKKKFTDKSRQMIYSHVGLVFLNHPVTHTPVILNGEKIGGGEFWVEELLKPCANLTPKSWITGLTQFFEDDPYDYRSIIMVPDQRVQDRIYDMIANKNMSTTFLGEIYNAASHYNNKQEQNSNQFVLELLAAAQSSKYSQIQSRLETHETLKRTGFIPTKIIGNSLKAGFITSWFAPDSMKINDYENPYARPYNVSEFITELSVREYMLRTKMTTPQDIHEVVLPMKDRFEDATKIESLPANY